MRVEERLVTMEMWCVNLEWHDIVKEQKVQRISESSR